MIEIPRNKNYFRNLERSGNGEYPPCVICGRGIKTKTPSMVHMFYGAQVVTEEEAKEIVTREGYGGDTGLHPIGNDCLKHHPEFLPYLMKG